MIIGVPKEIKNHEYRAGLTPASVNELTLRGHAVYIETNLGAGIGYDDAAYEQAGAKALTSAEQVFAIAEMIIKVKEPLAEERKLLREGQLLFTYLHLAPDAAQTKDLIDSKAICIAYETITTDSGELPLLAPMSEVAGRMSIQAGAACLEKAKGGSGVLLGGVPGVSPANVVIIGGGVVGSHAAQMAIGLGADVTILDNNLDTLRELNRVFGSTVKLIYSNKAALEEAVINADLVVGSVLIPGAAAPKLVTADMVKKMKTGAAVVDVAIDQGGCFETSTPTTHESPIYIVDGVVHYCVANIPGAVARTATQALNNATLPYAIRLADQGWQQTLRQDKHFANGLNVCEGKVTNAAVAKSHGLDYVEVAEILGQ